MTTSIGIVGAGLGGLTLARVLHTYVAISKPQGWIADIDFANPKVAKARVAEEFEGWAPELTRRRCFPEAQRPQPSRRGTTGSSSATTPRTACSTFSPAEKPYHTRVFVLTHHARPAITMGGGTRFPSDELFTHPSFPDYGEKADRSA
jgi:hypothetical protein